jgi:hypothetical protein
MTELVTRFLVFWPLTFCHHMRNLSCARASRLRFTTSPEIVGRPFSNVAFRRQYRQIPNRWVASLVSTHQTRHVSEYRYFTLDDVGKHVSFNVSVQDLALRRDQTAAASLSLS